MSRPKRKAVADTAKAAKRAKGETDLPWGLRWTQAGPDLGKTQPPLLVLDSDTLPGATRIAGFDIDWSVIRTASGRKFATGANDWEWWDECVPAKLKSLHKEGQRVAFFTNQAGIEKGNVTPASIRSKIEAMIHKLNIPVIAYVCTGTNHMRKPNPAPWEHLEKTSNGGVAVDRAKCLFVGDAAGRAKNWAPGKPKDFSCGDRMFAANLGIKFHTPEEFFLNEAPAPFTWGAFNPQELTGSSPGGAATETSLHSETPELVVMVAPPAAGKSTFCRRHFIPHGYVWVNRDTLSTPAKCLKVAEKALSEGQSVVIDNTNPSVPGRAEYINVAKKHKVPARCFLLETPLPLAHHLNVVRMNQSEGRHRRVPDVGYNIYKKNYQQPTTSEGFSDVIRVSFVTQFDSDKDKQLFNHWTA